MIGKWLIIIGLLLIVAGLFSVFKIPVPFLGKLPGDITIKGDHYQIYFPLATSLIVSLFLSIILYFISRFKS